MTTAKTETNENEALLLTADIVASYVSNNSLAADEVPAMIEQVYKTLRQIENRKEGGEALKPAVPVKKSVTPDYIVCLEDGKKLKMLRRHLRSRYNMSPEDYRERWGLPADYPMVAPNYAKKRQELAKKIGLGKKPRAAKAGTRKPAKT